MSDGVAPLFFRTVVRKLYPNHSFLKPLFIQNLNKSMLVTRKMLQSGVSVGQVMQQRRLKLGTVQDHIIEWALLEETFPFEKFIDNQQNLLELPEDS